VADAIIVMVSCASGEEAEKLALCLVEEKLAACGNILTGARSIFHWQGKLCKETEAVLLLKTREALFPRLRARVKDLHSYEVPEIIALPVVAGDEQYLAWLREQTSDA
jgi:periplasmic divalent cation tolerance protein